MNLNLVYSPRYNLSMLGLERLHPFDAHKYGRAWAIVTRRLGSELRRYWVEPGEPAADELLLTVHTPEYLQSLHSSGTLAQALDFWPAKYIPNRMLQSGLVTPMRFAVQGTVLAAELALRGGVAMNFGGGFHHAFRDHGEGFCLFADVALAIAAQRHAGRLHANDSIVVIDLDAHRGNGFYEIAGKDPGVHVFDVHGLQIYPGPVEDWAPTTTPFLIPVLPGCTDEQYQRILADDLPRFLTAAGEPKLAFYNAGTDILRGDPLGKYNVSREAVAARDRTVLEMLTTRKIPTVVVTSGGYTRTSHQLIAEMALYLAEAIG